jgi:phospholipid/cholesterol/gamma-HCH transport system substrate-binding protein
LFERLKSIRETADGFRHKSAKVMEEARQTLADLSEAANNMSDKLAPRATSGPPPAPARRPMPKRQ